MSLPKISLAILVGAGFIITGCASDRFDNPPPQQVRPDPIRAAPIGQVSQSNLPPTGGYPEAPQGNNSVQMASASPVGNNMSVANGIALVPATVAGVWKASVGGMNCQIATPMTKYGQGYRAGPLHCPSAFSSVNSWSVNGSQLFFHDSNGATIATLSSSDGRQFEGQTANGVQVVLSR